jgi:hypothetical protein
MAEDGLGRRSVARASEKKKTYGLRVSDDKLFPKRVRLKATIYRDLSKTSASLNPMNARITRHGTSKSSSRACARASSIAFRIRSSSNSSALCNGSRLGRLNPSSVIEYHIDIRARMSLSTSTERHLMDRRKEPLTIRTVQKVRRIVHAPPYPPVAYSPSPSRPATSGGSVGAFLILPTWLRDIQPQP